MNILLLAIYILLGMLIITTEIIRVRAKRPWDALSLFNGAYFLFFVFVPINVALLGEDAVRQKHVYQTWGHGDIWTASTLFLCYALFIVGYYRARTANDNNNSFAGLPPDSGKIAAKIAFAYLGAGCIALAYHINLVGGVFEALQWAPRVRTGEFQLTGKFLFVRQLLYFIATAFIIIWAVHLEQKDSSPSSHFTRCLIITLTGLLFIYYALSTYGRREFLYPMMICMLLWVLSPRRRMLDLAFLGGLAALWFVVYSIFIPSQLQSAQLQSAQLQSAQLQSAQLLHFVKDGYLRTIQGLGDSFMHFVAAQHADLWQFGFLSDIWELPLQFLPSSLLGIERPRGMFGATSEFILARPLVPGQSGEEPLGLHGYLLVNFSWAGLLLFFFLAGKGLRWVDHKLRPRDQSSTIQWLVFLWVVIGCLEYLREGVLILVIKPRFSWWVAITVLFWLGYQRQADKQNKVQAFTVHRKRS